MIAEGEAKGWRCVLDASALLAFLNDEPGGEVVEGVIDVAALSTVNWAEVVQKALDRAIDVEDLQPDLEALGLTIVPFTAAQAEQTARLRAVTRSAGLSLGDRACLALASELGLPALTTDRIWSELPLSVEVRVVR